MSLLIDLDRAKTTCQLIMEQNDASSVKNIIEDSRIRERSFGEFENKAGLRNVLGRQQHVTCQQSGHISSKQFRTGNKILQIFKIFLFEKFGHQ